SPAHAPARASATLPLDPDLRPHQHRCERAGEDQGPERISAQAPLPPAGEVNARIRAERGLSMVPRPKVTIHTDGACSGNPGPGGWGAILESGAHRKELTGGEALTTNNRMELMAAIAALEALKAPSAVDLYTDSNYLRDGITSWIKSWKKNGWGTAGRKPGKNAELWEGPGKGARGPPG